MPLRTQWKNRKLRSRRRRLEKEATEAAEESKRKKDHSIAEEWHTINSWELDSIDAEIKHNDSRALLDEAQKLYLPTPGPADKDKWVPKEDLNTFENWSVLTPEAMTELRAAIRKERRERREVVESWAKVVGAIITILTGLVGAAIGLVAVWNK
jgi:hypothetical protein